MKDREKLFWYTNVNMYIYLYINRDIQGTKAVGVPPLPWAGTPPKSHTCLIRKICRDNKWSPTQKIGNQDRNKSETETTTRSQSTNISFWPLPTLRVHLEKELTKSCEFLEAPTSYTTMLDQATGSDTVATRVLPMSIGWLGTAAKEKQTWHCKRNIAK